MTERPKRQGRKPMASKASQQPTPSAKKKPTGPPAPQPPSAQRPVAQRRAKTKAPAASVKDAKATPAVTATQGFKYDVCVSFAGEDRELVKKVVASLKRRKITCFYDFDEQANLVGKDLVEHLDQVYRKQARFAVMFLSQHYAKKLWTRLERKSILARVFESSEDYLIPIKLDDTEIPGVLPTMGYFDARRSDASGIAALIQAKVLGRGSARPGKTVPPATTPPTPARKKPVAAKPAAPRGRVTGSGQWMLLGDDFFQALEVRATKQTVTAQVAPKDAREEAALQRLDDRQPWQHNALRFAHGNVATLCSLKDVSSHSTNGKTVFTLVLQREDSRTTSYDYSAGGMSADQISESRARFVLLGERTRGDTWETRQIYGDYTPAQIARALTQLGGNATLDNLRKVRLTVLAELLLTGLASHVLEFTLGPATKGALAVHLEGQLVRPHGGKTTSFSVTGTVPLAQK